MAEITPEPPFVLVEYVGDDVDLIAGYSTLEEGLDNLRQRLMISFAWRQSPAPTEGINNGCLCDSETKDGIVYMSTGPYTSRGGSYSLRFKRGNDTFHNDKLTPVIDEAFRLIRQSIADKKSIDFDLCQNDAKVGSIYTTVEP